MKEGWKVINFKSCLEKTESSTKLPSSSYKKQGDFPIVSQEKEFISGYWNNEEDVFKHETPIIIFGDHTKIVKYIDFDFVIGADGVKILQPKHFLNPKYFYYWVMSVQIPNHGYARHFKYLKEHQVPVPPLSEQQRIVSILDAEFAKIDSLKTNAERNLQNAKDLFQSALKKELEPKKGWSKKKMGDVCEYCKEQGCHSNLNYVGLENVESGSGKILGTQKGENILSNTFRFQKGYVMYGRLRPYLKKIFVSDFEGCCSTEIFPIKTNGVLPHLLMYWLLSDAITDKINATCAGCRMPRANMNEVLNFDILLPPLSEQQSIVSRLDILNDKCKTLQLNYEKTIALCEDLKQAILRKAFNGEI